MRSNKSIFFLLTIVGIGVILLLVLIISSFFTPNYDSTNTSTPSLPSRNTTNPSDTSSYEFTPLQKTVIGKTDDEVIKKTNKVISETEEDGIKTYIVQSYIKQYTNEIKTKNGIVIFETTRTEIANPPPPTLSKFTNLYGEPELVLDSVSKIGKHVSAYIYATKGFTLFANRYTSTVYDIHRYTPMSLNEYQREYKEYIQPAPPYPQERPDAAN